MLPDIYPSVINYADIEQEAYFYLRVTEVDELFPNNVGISEGSVQWCPDNKPPKRDEYLAWLWVIKPSLNQAIMKECGPELKEVITAFEDYIDFLENNIG